MCIKGVSWGLILLLSFIVANVHSGDENILQFQYHNYELMTSFLRAYAKNNSDLTGLYSIGKSVRKRELWVIKITAVLENTSLTPNIKLLANIHGNEAAGREILLHFIPYLVTEYNEGNEKIKHILDNNIIHILPSLNPDGFENSREGKCAGFGRENSRDVDLNRSFPDFFRQNPFRRQPETEAVIKWMNEIQFILSASLHGGAMVVNYPFESTKEDLFVEVAENRSPDDDVFQSLALVYSKAHPIMHKGEPCPDSIDKRQFKNGITNGAAWYSLTGGMQDYNYAFHGCMELTLEVSCCKYPPAAELQQIWMDNKKALTEYCLQAGMGVKGTVMESDTGKPVANAKLTVIGRNMSFGTSVKGEFYRILLPGNYKLKIKATNYKSAVVPFTVQKQGDKKTMSVLSLSLMPGNDTSDTDTEPTTSTLPHTTTTEYHETPTTHKVLVGVRSNFDDGPTSDALHSSWETSNRSQLIKLHSHLYWSMLCSMFMYYFYAALINVFTN